MCSILNFNGYNCSACMELDLKKRGLELYNNLLINSKGYVTKLNENKFYCGSKF